MEIRHLKRMAVSNLIAFSLCGSVQAGLSAQAWRTGLVLSADLAGHGPGTNMRTGRPSRGDVWWAYCISSDGKSYAAVSRRSPARIGAKARNQVRFVISGTRMIVLDSRGGRHTLALTNRTGCR